jgi:hypothetical protein
MTDKVERLMLLSKCFKIKEGITLNEGSQSPNISNSSENSVPQNSENATGGFINEVGRKRKR